MDVEADGNINDGSYRHQGSFNMDAGEDPEIPIREPAPQALLADQSVTYEIIKGGTVKGRDLLADNQGYTYSLSQRRPHVTTWTCNNRGKGCAATVRQTGQTYKPGGREHNHMSNPDRGTHARARAMVRINMCIY